MDMSLTDLQESIITKIRNSTDVESLDMISEMVDSILSPESQPKIVVSEDDWASIARGDEDFRQGRVYSKEEVFAALEKKYADD